MKISIITVTLNSEKVLNDCLDSIATQKHNNIEHIIIDGASTDGTLNIIKKRKKQPKIIVSEKDNGIYDAMNKGIRYATGDIIGFLNSDDFYVNNNILSRVSGVFDEDASLDSCYADLIYTDQEDTSKIVRYWKSSTFNLGSFSKGWCPPHPTFFLRRAIFERYGYFNPKYHIASDVDLMMRLLEVHKISTRYVSELWVKMRIGGLSNKSLKTIWAQNMDVLSSLRVNGLSTSSISFFAHKIFSRGRQFIQRPIDSY